ncbi:MAG TPA: rhomboid family intramembrane serine protease [Solirubrobacteraceae bacterium]
MIPFKDNIPTERTPFVTLALIAANVIVFLIVGSGSHEMLSGGAVPHALTHSGARWGTLFSSMFLHASIVQLAGNMLFLWMFGNTIEDDVGHAKFLAVYVLGGLATLALQVAAEPNSLAPIVGAEGAVAAVLGGYIVLHPRGQVLTLVLIPFFFTVIEVPAPIMVAVWFAMQVAFAAVGLTDPVGATSAGAYFASVAGFALGALAIPRLTRRRDPVAA